MPRSRAVKTVSEHFKTDLHTAAEIVAQHMDDSKVKRDPAREMYEKNGKIEYLRPFHAYNTDIIRYFKARKWEELLQSFK